MLTWVYQFICGEKKVSLETSFLRQGSSNSILGILIGVHDSPLKFYYLLHTWFQICLLQ